MQRRSGVWGDVELERYKRVETQTEFAAWLGLSAAHYNNLISGKQALGHKSLKRLCQVFPQWKDRFVEVFFSQVNPDLPTETEEA